MVSLASTVAVEIPLGFATDVADEDELTDEPAPDCEPLPLDDGRLATPPDEPVFDPDAELLFPDGLLADELPLPFDDEPFVPFAALFDEFPPITDEGIVAPGAGEPSGTGDVVSGVGTAIVGAAVGDGDGDGSALLLRLSFTA